MLEAPPGSREDLVEAARTPCSPSELDTMLYGYTNSIYVLDHTPESLPDMDMLQLFASPAGRALVTSRDEHRLHHRPISTSSLSRELDSGGATPTSKSCANKGRTKKGLSSIGACGSGSSSAINKKKRLFFGSSSAPTSPAARQRKSSDELFKEAAEMLGLTCTFSDSCRCLDCQSSYFDYEEDYETRPELAAGTPVLLDHALTHPMACSIQ